MYNSRALSFTISSLQERETCWSKVQNRFRKTITVALIAIKRIQYKRFLTPAGLVLPPWTTRSDYDHSDDVQPLAGAWSYSCPLTVHCQWHWGHGSIWRQYISLKSKSHVLQALQLDGASLMSNLIYCEGAFWGLSSRYCEHKARATGALTLR